MSNQTAADRRKRLIVAEIDQWVSFFLAPIGPLSPDSFEVCLEMASKVDRERAEALVELALPLDGIPPSSGRGWYGDWIAALLEQYVIDNFEASKELLLRLLTGPRGARAVGLNVHAIALEAVRSPYDPLLSEALVAAVQDCNSLTEHEVRNGALCLSYVFEVADEGGREMLWGAMTRLRECPAATSPVITQEIQEAVARMEAHRPK